MKPSSRQKWITAILSIIFLGAMFIPMFVEAQGSTANIKPTTQGKVGSGLFASEDGGSIWNPLDVGKEIFLWAATQVGMGALTLLSWILGAVGIILDAVLNYTVYGMGENLKKITAIEGTWKTIRDFCNILFIFTLLYIAINTILQRVSHADKKLISSVIIAALLVNYSFFFTKIFIDISNVVTLRFYNAIQVDGGVQLTGSAVFGLGAAYMTKLGMVTIYTYATNTDPSVSSLVAMSMGAILMILASFMFFVISLLFVIRYVMLILLLIFSPIMFATSILPATKKYNQMWWKRLTNECLFAPAFMILTWVSLQIVPTPEHLTKASVIDILFNYIVVGAFMVAAIIVAKSFSEKGASVTGMIGSQIAGRTAKYVGKRYDNLAARGANNKYTSWATRVPGVGILDRSIKSGLTAAENSTYGGKRNFAAYDKDAKERGKALKTNYNNVQLRSAIAGLNSSTETTRQRAREEARKLIPQMSSTDIADLSKEDLTAISNAGLMTSQIASAIDKKENLSAEQKANLKFAKENSIFDAYIAAGDTPSTEQTDAVERAISNLSPKQFAALPSKYHQNPKIMALATTEQLNELMKSESVSAEDQKKIIDARYGNILKLADPASVATLSATELDEIKKSIGKLSLSDVEHLAIHNDKLLSSTEFISALKPKALEKLNESRLVSSQKEKIKETRIAPLKQAIADADPVKIKTQIVDKLDDKTIASLPIEILNKPEVYKHLTTNALREMREDRAKAAAMRKKITDDTLTTDGNVDKLKIWLSNKGADFGV